MPLSMLAMSTDSTTPETLETPRPKTAQRSLTPSDKALADCSFKPEMISSPDLRQKVKSSGYGRHTPVAIPKEIAPTDQQIAETKELTFKPNMGITSKKRIAVTSSGYGKTVAAPKELVTESAPTFMPDMTLTQKATKKAVGSGYGKATPEPKKVNAEQYAPSFTPNMDFGKKGEKLRKVAQARLLEPARPKTAPAAVDAKPRAPLRYTLAADHSAEPAEKEIEGPGFDFSGMATIGLLPPGQGETLLGKMPPPVTPTAFGKKLKKSATPTGYGSNWTPEVVPAPTKSPTPVMHTGTAGNTYIDSPGDIPVVQAKAFKSVVPNYGAGYEVVKGEMPPPKEASPKNYYAPGPPGELPPLATLQIFDNSKKNKNVPSTYGKAYAPLKAELPSPKAATERPFAASSKGDEIPQLNEIEPVRNDLDYVASSGYGIVSTHTQDYQPAHRQSERKLAPPVAPKPGSRSADTSPYPEEQTTIL